MREWAGADAAAKAWEKAADELEHSLRNRGEGALTLSEAAKVSGYSTDHLGRLVRKKRVQNVGRKSAPRIRRADLPQKPGRVASTTPSKYDPVADARSLLSRRGDH